MKISVIIPAYNSQATIARAIDSVLAQSRPADEIIVIDDGSTDKTADIVRSYGNKVLLIQQANAGVSIARNKGIEAAMGDWIAFLDADDEWLPDKLKLQSEHLVRRPNLKWTYTDMSWDKQKRGFAAPIHHINRLDITSKTSESFEDYFHAYTQGFFASTITLMIHRSVFETVGLFEPGMKRAQDNDLWFRIAYQYPQVGYLPQSLAIYHLDTPASSTKINDSVDFMIHLVHRHEELSKKYHRYEAFRPCLTHMLQTWIRQLNDQRRYTDARILLNQFRQYLSGRFWREMQFRLLCPPLTDPLADTMMMFKKTFKPREIKTCRQQ